MNIWIDLANSPHVLFFDPVIQRLKADGHQVLLTARDFAQTVPLARMKGWNFQVIGDNRGVGRWAKLTSNISRARLLCRWAAARGIDVACSHNSYAQAIAARMCRIPAITFMDFEHTPANHVSFRLAGRVGVPFTFSSRSLSRYGARPHKVFRYEGIKEQVYLSNFRPQLPTRTEMERLLGLPLEHAVIATVRPPASMAVYHAFENKIFNALLEDGAHRCQVRMILLPRTAEQARELASLRLPNVVIPDCPLDGGSLIHYSDLVVSGGGTMVREAAVLGTPAYTVFAGELGSVDRYLVDAQRLVAIDPHVAVPKDIAARLDQIKWTKKKECSRLKNPDLIDDINHAIVEASGDPRASRTLRADDSELGGQHNKTAA